MKKKEQKMDLRVLGMHFDEPGQLIVMTCLVAGLLFLYGWTIAHATSGIGRQVLGTIVYFGGPLLLTRFQKLDGWQLAVYMVPFVLGIAIIGFN